MRMRNLNWSRSGLNLNEENIHHLRFADVLVFFSEFLLSLELMLQQLSNESAKADLSMYNKKVKIMTNASGTYSIQLNN